MPHENQSVDRSHREQTGNTPQGNVNAPDSDFDRGNAPNEDNTSGKPGGTGVTSNQSAESPNRKV